MVNFLFPELFTESMFLTMQIATKTFYFGLTNRPFKERHRNHTRDFIMTSMRMASSSSTKYACQLKRSNINFFIKYSIVPKVHENPSSIISQLCFTGKLWITKFINNKDLMNKKSD